MDFNFKRVHFIGVCGTAMGAVASMLQDAGFEVSGSDDKAYPPMSTFLEQKGIRFFTGFNASNLDINPDIVVVGNVCSRGNPEVEAMLERRMFYVSLPEALKLFFLRSSHNLVVSGTHGKTTTTSMLTWMFECCDKKPNYLIGGIPNNLGQGCRYQKGEHWILEGDEYDTAFFDKRSKFLHYLPELVIINNVEFDHADIYASLEAIKLSFKRLVDLVPANGAVVVNADDANALDVVSQARCRVIRVGFSDTADIKITRELSQEDGSIFDFEGHTFTMPLTGRHNVYNAAMAVAASQFYHLPLEGVKKALSTFAGVKRRLEVRAEINGITIVDDFGHHPTALRETLTALRRKYPQRRIWALFEPRSNTTRRAVFQNELPLALALADGVYISAIARPDQLPENDRLNPEQVAAYIRARGIPAQYGQDAQAIVDDLVPKLQAGDVVAVFTNGDFDGIHRRLEEALKAHGVQH